jgi:hypothetical protein
MSPKQGAVPEAGAPPGFFPIAGDVKLRPIALGQPVNQCLKTVGH